MEVEKEPQILFFLNDLSVDSIHEEIGPTTLAKYTNKMAVDLAHLAFRVPAQVPEAAASLLSHFCAVLNAASARFHEPVEFFHSRGGRRLDEAQLETRCNQPVGGA